MPIATVASRRRRRGLRSGALVGSDEKKTRTVAELRSLTLRKTNNAATVAVIALPLIGHARKRGRY
jgi:hypothetical protein